MILYQIRFHGVSCTSRSCRDDRSWCTNVWQNSPKHQESCQHIGTMDMTKMFDDGNDRSFTEVASNIVDQDVDIKGESKASLSDHFLVSTAKLCHHAQC